jgi:hypothetical protein
LFFDDEPFVQAVLTSSFAAHHPPGSTLFVTYRLAGSIPQPLLRHYKTKYKILQDELSRVRRSLEYDKLQLVDHPEIQSYLQHLERFHRAWFLKFEETLDQARTGPTWLKESRIAAVVTEQLHALDDEAYKLDAYCVMSNHVHVIFTPFLTDTSLRGNFDQTVIWSLLASIPGYPRLCIGLRGAVHEMLT